MSVSPYGRKLNPYRRFRDPLAVKGIRQSVTITNNPSTIDQNQQLLVRFPNLGEHDVIVPGTSRLAFTISLTSADDDNVTVVNNLGRAIIKKTTIKISGNEVMSIDDSDVFQCYSDLWLTKQEKANASYRGIGNNNMLKLRVGAADGDASATKDKAIADVYSNRFYIPLDFELLQTQMPFYQSGLGDRLEYELSFNNYSRVIKTTDIDASYKIDNISLEFDMVTEPGLAREISNQYSGKLAILYDRVLRHRTITLNKKDTLWNINLNCPMKSCKGLMMIFEETTPWNRDTTKWYNPKITKVDITIEGKPNQLYSQGMHKHNQWDEAIKFFAGNNKRDPTVNRIIKDLELYDVNLSEFLTSRYAMWLDFRTSEDDQLHGSGRQVLNASEGITLQITKDAESAGVLNLYLYVIMDAQLNIQDGRFVSAIY